MKLRDCVLSALILAGMAVPAAAQVKLGGKPKIAFIFYGTTSDGGWATSQNDARLALQKTYGQKIPYVENVPEVTAKGGAGDRPVHQPRRQHHSGRQLRL